MVPGQVTGCKGGQVTFTKKVLGGQACIRWEMALDLNRDDLSETNPVDLPGVAARGSDICSRRPHPPTRSHVWEDRVRLQQVQLGRQVGPFERFD